MMDWVQRKGVVAAALAALMGLAGCTAAGTNYSHGQRPPTTLAPPGAGKVEGVSAPVVTGICPQVSLREGTAFLRKYAGNAKDDPSKLIVQASLAETTRQCTTNETGALTITVMAQGRLVAGPMGKAGSYSLPIRVAVIQGDQTLYTNLVKINAELPAGQPSAQFLFSKADVTVPAGVSGTARIFLGFDEGPYNTQ
jgi:hypothetical protein